MTEKLLMSSPSGVQVFYDDTRIRMTVPKPVTPQIAAEAEQALEILNMVTPFGNAGVLSLDDQQVLYGLEWSRDR